MKRTRTMIITTVILSFALTSVFAFDTESTQSTQTNSADILPLIAVEAVSGDVHDIEMEAVAMPDGLYAYRMVSYTITVGGDEGPELVGTQYSGKPSIPGPTIIMNEGDHANITLKNSACEDDFPDGPAHPLGVPTFSETSLLGIHVHGVHYDISDDASYARMNMAESSGAACGGTIDYSWEAAPGTAGAWPYHDHMFAINEVGAEELGLFGTLIVNPGTGQVNGFVDDGMGEIQPVDVEDIEKEFVLWMVSSETLGRSIFYGNEIDYSTTDYDGNTDAIRETALWTNPNLVATDGKIYRFHVLGLGDEVHAFHLHGHRWTEDIHETATAEDVIDVKEIAPMQRHSFVVKASDNDAADTTHDGPEGWMYHCHVLDHMKQGMTGMMMVQPDYQSDDLPIIGATFTLSDEPGLWMKTLDAGVVEGLDEHLASLGLPSVDPTDGTGFPLSYISEALGDVNPAFETDFSNSEGRSLAVIHPGETVLFGMKDSQTKHTITTLIYPSDAPRLGGNGILNAADAALGTDMSHFDTQLGIRGSTLLVDKAGVPTGLTEPGLYVFVCKIHPYMFGAVIVDDPNTNLFIGGDPDAWFPLLDVSDELVVLTRTGTGVSFGDPDTVFPTAVPPTHALAKTLLTTFYVITDPNNWRDYQESTWTATLPPVLVTTNTEELAVGLAYTTAETTLAATTLDLKNSTGGVPAILGFDLGVDNAPNSLFKPKKDGIGEVWVNTQFEETVAKNHEGTPADKPGTITVVDADKWKVERKIALPDINMNHPHNMWANAQNDVIFQTQWFGSEMAVIDRESGELIKEVFTGQSPSHVMTSPATGDIYIAVNGEETVNEFDSETFELERQISTGFRSHPHGHWISSSGQYVVTPDFLGLKASIIDLDNDSFSSSDNVLFGPIATGMKGDESVFYTADFLGNSMTAIDPTDGSTVGTIDFLTQGLVGLPIQTPISPDDKWMVTALTLGGKLAVIDVTSTPGTIEAILDCDPGCHGVQWGAKENGGYYAYVSSKFSNAMLVVDPEAKNGPEVVGKILLADRSADTDDRVIEYDGMGGQGILTVPNVYEGWIQQTVEACSDSKGKIKKDICGDEIAGFLKDLKNSHLNPLDSDDDEDEEEDD